MIRQVWAWIKEEATRPTSAPFGLSPEFYEKQRERERLDSIEKRLKALEDNAREDAA